MTDSQLKVFEPPMAVSLRADQQLYTGAMAMFFVAVRAVPGVSKESPKPHGHLKFQ